MGTPNERTWPEVTSIPYYRTNFPKWNPTKLVDFVPNLEPAGVDLLYEMLCMDPARRISAHEALVHEYFRNDNNDNDNDDDDYEEEDDDDGDGDGDDDCVP